MTSAGKNGKNGKNGKSREKPAVACDTLEWLESPLGRLTLSQTTEALTQCIHAIPGEELLTLGAPLPEACLQGSLLRARYLGVRHFEEAARCREKLGAKAAKFVADFSMLPFSPDSVNAVVVHHGLDITSRPHGLIREAARILAPGGHLIVTGFNPWSLWGMRRLLARRRDSFPWNGNFIAPHRLTDWLRLLGFTLDNVSYFLLRPPIADVKLWDRPWCRSLRKRIDLPLGGVYLARARKQAVIVRPLRQRRSVLRPAVIGMPMPKPTARQ